MRPVHIEQSRAIPISPEDAYRATLPIDLTRIMHRWYGPLPPIKSVEQQTGAWQTPGQTRTIVLVGGATMHEQLTHTDPPQRFDYELTSITGALALLVDHIDGAWAFAPAGTGTEVTWSWTMHPRSAATRPAVVLLGRAWPGYARQALAALSDELV